MSLAAFLAEAALISLSGVMGPGPMTATAVGKGNDSPHAGALMAIGHGIVELPLMIVTFYGFGALLNLAYVKAAIAFVGGVFLLVMAIGMFRSLKLSQIKVQPNKYTRSPVVAGMILSLGNPYFLIWWATVGAALVLRSVGYGMVGFAIFAFAHWMCDFLWLYALSILSFKGGQLLGQRFQRAVFAMCGVFLLFFGGRFILDAARELFL